MPSIYYSLLPLLTGGQPALDTGYFSPGGFVNDGFGGKVSMKGQSVSFVYNQTGTTNYWTGFSGKLNYNQYQALFDAGFGVSSHEFYGNLEGLSDEELYEVSQLYVDFVEDYYGTGFRPLSNVMGGGTIHYNVEIWNQGWFDRGAFFSINGSGNASSYYDLEDDFKTYTTTLVRGIKNFDGKSASYMTDFVDDLMMMDGHKGLRVFGHNLTPDNYRTNYFSLNNMFSYIETNFADELWVPSINELTKYLHVRDKVVYHQKITDNKLTITLDESAIPDFIIPRALTFKVTSDANIQSITVKGFDSRTKGERTNQATIDLQW